MITTGKELGDLVQRLKAVQHVGLDTEADSLHAYPEKVCLIQLSIEGLEVLVDPLAGLDLTALWTVLEEKELILHGADYDLRMLHRAYGFVPAQIFDTMLAARLLGMPKVGLADLVAKFFGVRLDKAPQKANWAIRPLTPRMVSYAISDTKYLRPLAVLLKEQLEAKGRLEWHRQLCEQVIRDCATADDGSPKDAWRIKGSTRLTRRGLGVLRSIWEWRESEALSSNRPPFFVLPHTVLVQIAELAAARRPFDHLIPARFSERRRAALVNAVKRGMSLPEKDLPLPACSSGRSLSLVEKVRLEKLRVARDRAAAKLGLDPALIASRAMLIALAHDWESGAARLLPWQRALLESSHKETKDTLH